MSKAIDSELDEIAAAHNAAVDAANQSAARIQADVTAFIKAWEACRYKVVKPTLNEVVAKLTERGMPASVGDSASGISFSVLPAEMSTRPASREPPPNLLIAGTPGANRVTFRLSTPGARQVSYPVGEITEELIERHALELIRSVYARK
jgi:hypothetical protein